jgi:hypothetical protein
MAGRYYAVTVGTAARQTQITRQTQNPIGKERYHEARGGFRGARSLPARLQFL